QGEPWFRDPFRGDDVRAHALAGGCRPHLQRARKRNRLETRNLRFPQVDGRGHAPEVFGICAGNRQKHVNTRRCNKKEAYASFFLPERENRTLRGLPRTCLCHKDIRRAGFGRKILPSGEKITEILLYSRMTIPLLQFCHSLTTLRRFSASLVVLTIVFNLVVFNATAQTIVWSDSFEQGEQPTRTQCNNWSLF